MFSLIGFVVSNKSPSYSQPLNSNPAFEVLIFSSNFLPFLTFAGLIIVPPFVPRQEAQLYGRRVRAAPRMGRKPRTGLGYPQIPEARQLQRVR